MNIPFNLPWVYCPGSSDEENAVVLRHLLECLTAINVEYLQRHPTRSIFQAGVRYGRTFEWDSIPAVIRRGYGDCKSLSAWYCAELRLRGEKCRPIFKMFPSSYGAPNFHIWVATSEGEVDPSAKLGMNEYLRAQRRRAI